MRRGSVPGSSTASAPTQSARSRIAAASGSPAPAGASASACTAWTISVRGDPVVEGIDPPDQPVAVQHRQHVVAVLSLRARHVHLQPILELEQPSCSLPIVDQPVERGEQRRARTPGPFERRPVRVPLARQRPDCRRPCDAPAHQCAERPLPAGRAAVEREAELADPGHTSGGELALEDRLCDRAPGNRGASIGYTCSAMSQIRSLPSTADDADPAREPQDVEHSPDVLAVVPAAGAPRFLRAVLDLPRPQRPAPRGGCAARSLRNPGFAASHERV